MMPVMANLAWLASQTGARSRFLRQLADPLGTQARLLRTLISRHAATEFGRQHHFDRIDGASAFVRQVPLHTYEDLAPAIERIRRGEPNPLGRDPVTHLVPTSGSSGAAKLIPFTASLQREFQAAIGPWICDLYRAHPRALLGPSYWAISPAPDLAAWADSAVPVGFEDDSQYLGGLRQRLVASALAAPSALRTLTNRDTFNLLTAVCLLRQARLGVISVWHPSFLLLVLNSLRGNWEEALEVIATGRLAPARPVPAAVVRALALRANPARARRLRSLGPDRLADVWPGLSVISCWTQGHAALAAAEVARRFPRVTLQPKGLLATEGVVTLPFAGQQPLAVGSHVYEFLDPEGRLESLETLRVGAVYEVVLTTGGGLWRYRLGDCVRVTGRLAATPCLEFVGRAGAVSDRFGEKLSEDFVAAVLRGLVRDTVGESPFAMLAPEGDGTRGHYALLWDCGPAPDEAQLDRLLCQNPHYDWCRRLGQLERARVVPAGPCAFQRYIERLGPQRRLGELKPPALAQEGGWTAWFTRQS